jgi:UDP-glucose 4-epimerase
LRVLILGSEGFIGSHCIAYFLDRHHEVSGIDLFEQPSRQYRYTKVSRLSPELDEVFISRPFDVVINVPYSMTHPVIDFEANSLDTIRVLEAIRKHQPACKYIHLSSAAVYGNPVRLPVCEEDTTMPLSPYGWHKLIAEQLCKEYTSIYNLRIAIVRPFSVYGQGLKKQLFWDLYQKNKNASGPMELHGTGQESRDFIHVKDVMIAIEHILENGPLRAEVYNLACGVEATIAEAVTIFMEAIESKVTFRFNGVTRAGDPLNWRADISKIKALGFIPHYTLRTGLGEVSTWLQTLS